MAYSCEPRRKRAYSNDLRWRMVWQREVLDYTYEEVARNLNVDVSTVWRVVELFRDYGAVDKKHYSRSDTSKKLTPPLELYLLHAVMLNPGIYLRELQQDLCDTTGCESQQSAVSFTKLASANRS